MKHDIRDSTPQTRTPAHTKFPAPKNTERPHNYTMIDILFKDHDVALGCAEWSELACAFERGKGRNPSLFFPRCLVSPGLDWSGVEEGWLAFVCVCVCVCVVQRACANVRPAMKVIDDLVGKVVLVERRCGLCPLSQPTLTDSL